MSRVYESLKGVVQETLQRSKAAPVPINRRTEEEGNPNLNDKMEEIEKAALQWIGNLKTAVKQRESVASTELRRAEETIQDLREEIASLQANLTSTESKLAATEEIVHERKDSIKKLEQSSAVKIQELETELKKTQDLLSEREKQLNDFASALKVLKTEMKDISAYFRHAEDALATIDVENLSKTSPSSNSANGGERPPSNGAPAPSHIFDTPEDTVPPKFFDRMSVALTHVLGPKASTIVRDHVAALGESTERFPKARIPELIEIVSQEISDDNLKIGFREVLSDSIEQRNYPNFVSRLF
jgi:hypothetical protein